MAAIVLNDVLKVRFVSYTPTQVGINVVHYKVTAVNGAPTTIGVAQGLDSISIAYKACMSSAARWRGTGVSVFSPVPTAEDSFVGNDGVGGGGADLLATQTCGIVTKKGFFPNRHNYGRAYIAFPSVGMANADGSPTAAYVTTLAALAVIFGPSWTAVGVGADTVDLTMHIAEVNALGQYVNSVAVSSLRASKRFATQRSRGMYGAQNAPPF